MFNAYMVKPADLTLSVQGETRGADVPFSLSATPLGANGLPIGLVTLNGAIYGVKLDAMPTLVVYKGGGAEIRQNASMDSMLKAKFIVSGIWLVKDNENYDEPTPEALNLQRLVRLDRLAVGTTQNGDLMFAHVRGTVAEVRLKMYSYGCVDALMLAWGQVFLNAGGNIMGTAPITVLEAKSVKVMEQPIHVIDAGHGGTDPGAIGFGLHEKNVNLVAAKAAQAYLSKKYIGTFLLLRGKDETIELNDRPVLANNLGADGYLSFHVNGAVSPQANGFESFIYTKPSLTSIKIQAALHTSSMKFLKDYGIVDRGMKKKDLCVVRETKCPAVLVENLFISNPTNNKLLKDNAFVQRLAEAQAEGYAQGFGLKKRPVATTVTANIPVPQVTYKVQVGNFTFKKNAEDLLKELESKGVYGNIVEVK